jgi:hypothetical protein
VTDYGCDFWPGVEPEVYYSFELEREGQATVVAAATTAAEAVESEEFVEYRIDSPTYDANLYIDGRGSMILRGTMWDQDDSDDEVMGRWNLEFEYGTTTGQRIFTRSSCGEVELYVTISKRENLYD